MGKTLRKVCVLTLVCAIIIQPMMGNLGQSKVSAAGIADEKPEGGGSTIISPQEEKTMSPSQQPIVLSDDVNIEGYQISSTLQGSRVVASVEPTINNKKVENWGLVYAITKVGDETLTVTDEDMFVGTTNKYAMAIQSTPEGTADVKFGNSVTATYYVRTMLFGAKNVKEYTAQYKVRAYAKLSDGSYVYSKVSSYNVYKIADLLYASKKMDTKAGHNYLYHSILKVVNADYEENDYDWSDVVVGTDVLK